MASRSYTGSLSRELVEARAVAASGRPSEAALPCVLGPDLEVHDGVPRQGLAHPLGLERAAAQRDDAARRAREQLEGQLSSRPRNAGSPSRSQVVCDRLAERPLELAGRGRARAPSRRPSSAPRRLARPHEAHEDHAGVGARAAGAGMRGGR